MGESRPTPTDEDETRRTVVGRWPAESVHLLFLVTGIRSGPLVVKFITDPSLPLLAIARKSTIEPHP